MLVQNAESVIKTPLGSPVLPEVKTTYINDVELRDVRVALPGLEIDPGPTRTTRTPKFEHFECCSFDDRTIVAFVCSTIVLKRSSGWLGSSMQKAAPVLRTPSTATVVHIDFSKHMGTISP